MGALRQRCGQNDRGGINGVNKQRYLDELNRHIKMLPKEEQSEILEDYEEHFEHARLSGRTDSEIIAKLGTPQTIAKEILAQSEIARAQENPTLNNVTRAVLAALGLGMLNILFVLVPFLLGLILLVALVILALFLIASPVILMIQDGFTNTYLKESFLIVGLVGLGLLVLLGTMKLTTWFYKQIIVYLNFNIKVMRRK